MHGTSHRARLTAILIVAWATLACAAAPTSPDATRTAEVASGRVLVAPLNLAIRATPALEEGMEPTYRALLEHYQQQDRALAVIDARDAIHLWNQVVSEGGEAPAGEALRAAASRFAVRLAEEQSYGMLVFPALLVRRALVQGYQVSWDGVRHPLPKSGFIEDSLSPSGALVASDGLQGSIAASSLHLAIFAADGTLLHEGIGGMGVLQRAERVGSEGRRRWILAQRKNAFADNTRLRAGVERAFIRPLPLTARAW